MKKIIMLSLLCLLGLGLCSAIGCSGQESPVDASQNIESANQQTDFEWAGSWDTAFSQARSEEKVVLVTFYADWCIWCKRLEDTTLANGSVATFLAEYTIPVRLDVDGDGRELSDQYGVDGLPTVLVLSTDGKELGRIPGYLPPEGFLERIRSFVS